MLEEESLLIINRDSQSAREPGEPAPVVLPPSDESPLAELGKAWKKSVYLKILSLIIVITLFGMITFIMLSNSASKNLDECKEKLSNEETNTQQCMKEKESLEGQVETQQKELKKKQEEHKGLNETKSNLLKIRNDLTEESDHLQNKIGNLTKENNDVQNRVNRLLESKKALTEEISRLNKDIEEINKTITNTKTEVKKLNDTEIWYIAGVVGIGLTDILTIYQAFSVNRELRMERERLSKYTEENRRIQADIDKLAIIVKKLEEEKKTLEDEYRPLHKQLQECEHIKTQVGIDIQNCGRRKEAVRREMLAMKKLAIEQAKAYYLKRYAKYMVEIDPLYNSTRDKFSLEEFRTIMTDRNNPVVVLNTTNRRLFGIGLNKEWPKDNGKYSMNSSFTFSIKHGALCTSVIHKDNFELKDGYFFQLGPPEISVKFFNETLAEGVANATEYFNCRNQVDENDNYYDIGANVKYTHIYGYNIILGKVEGDYEDII